MNTIVIIYFICMEVASIAWSMWEERFLPLGKEIKDDTGTVKIKEECAYYVPWEWQNMTQIVFQIISKHIKVSTSLQSNVVIKIYLPQISIL